jgi:hypothetical protein
LNSIEKELPLSFRSVKTVAATKNTMEMATQKCYRKQNEKHFQCNQASKTSIFNITYKKNLHTRKNITSITKFWIDSSSNYNRAECLPWNIDKGIKQKHENWINYIYKALQEEFPILLHHSCFLHPLALELYTFCTDNKRWLAKMTEKKSARMSPHDWLRSEHFEVEKHKRQKKLRFTGDIVNKLPKIINENNDFKCK